MLTVADSVVASPSAHGRVPFVAHTPSHPGVAVLGPITRPGIDRSPAKMASGFSLIHVAGATFAGARNDSASLLPFLSPT